MLDCLSRLRRLRERRLSLLRQSWGAVVLWLEPGAPAAVPYSVRRYLSDCADPLCPTCGGSLPDEVVLPLDRLAGPDFYGLEFWLGDRSLHDQSVRVVPLTLGSLLRHAARGTATRLRWRALDVLWRLGFLDPDPGAQVSLLRDLRLRPWAVLRARREALARHRTAERRSGRGG